ncbi:MAG: hypothetical protein H8E40_08070 [Chloroflexi bacterium]|nr:hypothetical protein [Chloroflexota bacterium]MBL7061499.1 hypothetical protein [Dehalococcoidia bacterium]
MRRHLNFIILAAILIALSALVYFVHYAIFHDVHHIFIYMVGDLAFLPLEVFLVVIVIERVLARREKQAIMQKLNMVVGAFFSEAGNELLQRLLGCFDKSKDISQHLAVKQNWTHADFKKAMSFARAIDGEPDCSGIDLNGLKKFLIRKRQFLLALLENPNLLEHERFTDLLWATFHLTEELEARESLTDIPGADIGHIAGDIQRVYSQLIVEWLCYVEHLKSKYPYLFSLVARTHPFQEHPSPVVV